MTDDLKQRIAVINDRLVETRHYIHRWPELSDHEEKTAEFVAGRLRALGLEVQTEVGGHGVIADLDGAAPGKRIAIRADMDGLPIQEESDLPYRSQNSGVMHACGHDGHTTTLLGAAEVLTSLRDQIKGSIRFLFQPAEETVGGAKRMCEQGAMRGVDAVVGLHGWPQVGIGQIGIRAGAMMASSDTFDITVRGRQAHAAYPHDGVDPIVVGAQIVSALQTISSREIDPSDPIVVTVGQFHAGTAYNIIPATATINGTYRTLSPKTRESMPGRIRRIAEGVCAAASATCDIAFHEGTPPVMNDAEFVGLVEEVASRSLGNENIVQLQHSSMGAEDFAVYLEHAPGAMFRLGLGDVSPIHTPTFNFEDRAIPVGVELFSRIALRYLEK
jgi:amidohydrolase